MAISTPQSKISKILEGKITGGRQKYFIAKFIVGDDNPGGWLAADSPWNLFREPCPELAQLDSPLSLATGFGPINENSKVIVPLDKVGYIFDLALPTQPQIENAKVFLTQKQQETQQLTNKPRHRGSLWVTYLRLLDAVDEGVPWYKRATRLFPPENYPPEVDDAEGRSKKDAENQLRAARRLGDYGWLTFSLMPKKLLTTKLDA